MNIERQIEFDKIKEMWDNLAITDGAKEKIRETSLCFSENELRKQLKDTTDARNMMEKLGTPPLQNISEIKEILLIAEKGDCLTPYQLERVANKDSFVIMDELGSGTDPTEGMGIAIAILEELKKSCAFYIADRLGMPNEMLKVAIRAAYGEDAVETYQFQKPDSRIAKKGTAKIYKSQKVRNTVNLSTKYQIGDSVMVYPEDYDFSVIFETVENRKKRHDMERKYTDDVISLDEI